MGTVYLAHGEVMNASPFVQLYRSVRMFLELLMDVPRPILVLAVLILGAGITLLALDR